ncbi:unnamed protein product [Sphagnum jensenii]|uniref:Uncharacterized protein n=1 Tax=Sphagnum jensenii TaxID=128206 RepID=A0ABP1AXC9_9BRYO
MSIEGRFQETLTVVCVAIVADRGAPGFEIRAKRLRMMMMMMMMQPRMSIQAKKEEEKIVYCLAGQRNGNRSEKQAEEEATEEVHPVEEEAYCLLEIEKDENLRS